MVIDAVANVEDGNAVAVEVIKAVVGGDRTAISTAVSTNARGAADVGAEIKDTGGRVSGWKLPYVGAMSVRPGVGAVRWLLFFRRGTPTRVLPVTPSPRRPVGLTPAGGPGARSDNVRRP